MRPTPSNSTGWLNLDELRTPVDVLKLARQIAKKILQRPVKVLAEESGNGLWRFHWIPAQHAEAEVIHPKDGEYRHSRTIAYPIAGYASQHSA